MAASKSLVGHDNSIPPQRIQRTERVVDEMDRIHGEIAVGTARLFPLIAELDRRGIWSHDGCRDMAEWLCGRYGFTRWSARRWVHASHALEGLPKTAVAFSEGRLSVDKVVEVARFVTPDTESEVITWAERMTVQNVRRRADVETRPNTQDTRAFDRERSCAWWFYDEGRRVGIEAHLSAAEGHVVIDAIEVARKSLPRSPEDPISEPDVFGQDWSLDARRADGLIVLAGGREKPSGSGRSTVVVHADLDAFVAENRHAELEGGGVIPPETLHRLACDCDLEAALHDGGKTLGIGRSSRTVPAYLLRQLRRRDRTCLFRGCHRSADLQAHHIIHWSHGGLTELQNLGLLCPFHHKLVHEYGWSMTINERGSPAWFRPDGRPCDPTPAFEP